MKEFVRSAMAPGYSFKYGDEEHHRNAKKLKAADVKRKKEESLQILNKCREHPTGARDILRVADQAGMVDAETIELIKALPGY